MIQKNLVQNHHCCNHSVKLSVKSNASESIKSLKSHRRIDSCKDFTIQSLTDFNFQCSTLILVVFLLCFNDRVEDFM